MHKTELPWPMVWPLRVIVNCAAPALGDPVGADEGADELRADELVVVDGSWWMSCWSSLPGPPHDGRCGYDDQ